jgi:putative transposase
MGRMARVVAAKYPDHVTQRGNGRQDTFFCEDDELLIHRHEQTGRPLGNIHFIKRLESKLDKDFSSRKRRKAGEE